MLYSLLKYWNFMIRLYGIPNCKQITNTKALFKENGIEYKFIHVKKTPIPQEQLSEIISQLGQDIVVNRRGMMYRKLGLKDKNLSPQEEFKYLLSKQGMIKRPLIEKEGKYLIGFDENVILNFVTGK